LFSIILGPIFTFTPAKTIFDYNTINYEVMLLPIRIISL
jgi:hypothetical protein